MFENDYTINGKHATYLKFLAKKNARDDQSPDNPTAARLFERYIDVYMNAAVFGLLYNRTAKRDIIEYQQPDTTVRLVGRTNNPDGGRDIIIRRKEGENRKLTICQCKAYQNSVNKSHVTDIRDTLDYYEATGFLLAVTSDITAPLIDHLTSLEKKYDVDWWTRRELFKIMRQYPSLVNAYQDIIKVVDNKEGQS